MPLMGWACCLFAKATCPGRSPCSNGRASVTRQTPAYFPWMAAALGAAYALGGRGADAMSLLTQGIEQATAMEMGRLSGALYPLPWGGAAAGRAPGGGTRPRRTLPGSPGPGRSSACVRPQAHCHRSLGTLYSRVGREPQARAVLSTAIELYRAMAMTFWLPQAEAALAQVEAASAHKQVKACGERYSIFTQLLRHLYDFPRPVCHTLQR